MSTGNLFHFYFRGGLTLEDALNMVYEDNINVKNIYLEPPDGGALKDNKALAVNMGKEELTINRGIN